MIKAIMNIPDEKLYKWKIVSYTINRRRLFCTEIKQQSDKKYFSQTTPVSLLKFGVLSDCCCWKHYHNSVNFDGAGVYRDLLSTTPRPWLNTCVRQYIKAKLTLPQVSPLHKLSIPTSSGNSTFQFVTTLSYARYYLPICFWRILFYSCKLRIVSLKKWKNLFNVRITYC